MGRKGFGAGVMVGALSAWLFGQWIAPAMGRGGESHECIPAEIAADYVHSAIQADRTFYTTDVVERMQMRGTVVASENWRAQGTLPLPAQFLMESALLMRGERNGIRVRLLSNWAINKRNRPSTDFERTGLTEILVNSDRPHTGVITEDGGRYFQAIYPDKAVSQTCVGCHNAHPSSPKKDFKLRDVMGGIVITIPLAAQEGRSE
ncbi:conserved exported protein of unknown function [Nitrospira sp. KM1]|uniref:Tll0287-like domain-containing protein n=1 Tax=Nitrospira sp. KM1 TaxID=1936990 RepID=UPI0013A75DE7|nr:DUF3365 domain-containing protein [Nitrospira sp. KM1]BCA53832.1 conserved exported protein of unknown function [Nitrospira sp. KM1]